jgi:hypothetical protein
MQDFETHAEDAEVEEGEESVAERSKDMLRYLLKRFILIVSFGPGILGFLWLIGRIVRR